MDEKDVQYMLRVLQQKSTELFQVSISYEAKFLKQNDIIDQQNKMISDLQDQVQTLSKPKSTRGKKVSDAGEF